MPFRANLQDIDLYTKLVKLQVKYRIPITLPKPIPALRPDGTDWTAEELTRMRRNRAQAQKIYDKYQYPDY